MLEAVTRLAIKFPRETLGKCLHGQQIIEHNVSPYPEIVFTYYIYIYICIKDILCYYMGIFTCGVSKQAFRIRTVEWFKVVHV